MIDFFVGMCLISGMTIGLHGACLIFQDRQREWVEKHKK